MNARENARIVRENLTSDYWEQINSLYHLTLEGSTPRKLKSRDPRQFFTAIRQGCYLLNGIGYGTMARSEGWHFGQTGTYLERADNTSRILDVKYHNLLPSVDSVGSPLDLAQWGILLRSANGFSQYRREYGKLNPNNIVEFLVFNKKFPRSTLYSLIQSEYSLHEISGGHQSGFKNLAEREIGALRSEVEFADLKDILARGLHEYLDKFQIKINSISNAIDKTYFSVEN